MRRSATRPQIPASGQPFPTLDRIEDIRAEVIRRINASRRRLETYQSKQFVQMRSPEGVRDLYRAQPKQDELHACNARYVLFGGAAGGSKSHGLRWDAILKCRDNVTAPRKALFLRRTYPELEKSHLLELPLEVPPEVAEYQISKYTLKFPNGSVLVFAHLQDAKALGALLSSQWDLIYIDQAETFTPHMLKMLRGRLRTKNKATRPQMILAANPGGDGHLYLQQHWIDRDPPKSITPNYKPEDWHFIPAFVWDNAYMQDDYIDELLSFTGPERDAYLYGKWTAFEGQFFREWDPAVHVITEAQAEKLELPGWMPREGGMDWGFSPDPWVLEVAAFDGYGRPTVFKEMQGTEMTPVEVAEAIDTAFPEGRATGFTIHCAPDMKKKGVESGVSIMDQLNDRLADLGSQITLEPANNDRMNGWMRVRSFLSPKRRLPDRPGRGPWLRVVATTGSKEWGCPYLISTMPAQRHHATRKGDMASSSTDHPPDALRYLLMSREPLAVVPEEAKPAVPHHKRVHDANAKKLLDMIRHKRSRESVLEGELPAGPAVDETGEDLSAPPGANAEDLFGGGSATNDFWE